MNKQKLLSTINIAMPIILIIVLFFITDINEQVLSIMMLTLFVGFVMPFICLLITGLSLLNDSHHKTSLTINILNIFLSSIIIYLIALLLDKNLLTALIGYILMTILSIINIIYYIVYLKKHPNMENKTIKEEKKKNNGAIV